MDSAGALLIAPLLGSAVAVPVAQRGAMGDMVYVSAHLHSVTMCQTDPLVSLQFSVV